MMPDEPPLPPARFTVGDRVVTRWGSATVLRVYDRARFESREYHVRHDFVSDDVPPGFGHRFSEHEMEPGRPREVVEAEPPEASEPDPATPQMHLF